MSDGFADLGDGRLWYERAGDGFPVVLVHSGLMDARVGAVAETNQLVSVGKPERFNRLPLEFLAFAG